MFHKKLSRPQFYFIVLIVGFILVNIPVYAVEISRITNYNRVITHNVVGFQFKGLDRFIPKETQFISYITDGNLKSPERYKLFQKAQYVMTPFILDPDNQNHEYVLIVCESPVYALKTIKEKNLVPLQLNPQHGILLAQKK